MAAAAELPRGLPPICCLHMDARRCGAADILWPWTAGLRGPAGQTVLLICIATHAAGTVLPGCISTRGRKLRRYWWVLQILLVYRSVRLGDHWVPPALAAAPRPAEEEEKNTHCIDNKDRSAGKSRCGQQNQQSPTATHASRIATAFKHMQAGACWKKACQYQVRILTAEVQG